MSLLLPVREDLAGLEPYGAPQLGVPVRLNINENPHAPSPEIIADITHFVTKAAPTLNRYLDRDFTELRYALADYLEMESGVRHAPGLVRTASSSNKIMTQIPQAFGGPGRTLVFSTPTYFIYHEYVRDTNTVWVRGRRLDGFSLNLDAVVRILARERPAMPVFTSPNNPTDMAPSRERQQTIMEMTYESGPIVDGCPSAVLIVIDEAYGKFRREGAPSVLELPEGTSYLVVVRTVSKVFGVVGLRLGYVSVVREIIDAVTLVRLLYHLSALTQAAAFAALRYKNSLMAQVNALHKECDDLIDWSYTCGFYTLDLDTNSAPLGTFGDRAAVFEALLARDVLIRVIDPKRWLRISVGIPEETRLLTITLRGIT